MPEAYYYYQAPPQTGLQEHFVYLRVATAGVYVMAVLACQFYACTCESVETAWSKGVYLEFSSWMMVLLYKYIIFLEHYAISCYCCVFAMPCNIY